MNELERALLLIGCAASIEAGIIDLNEAREILGLPEITKERMAALRKAANFTKTGAFRLPGYALALEKGYAVDELRVNE